MIRPDEEQHDNFNNNNRGYDIESSGDDNDDDNEDAESGEDDNEEGENYIEIDERTLIAIIKVQALIRGFLTRKMIFEHL